MSWWDAKQFTSLASNAFKNAQKKIDKVLDIPTEDESGSATLAPARSRREESQPANSSWSAWSTPATFLPSTPKSSTFSEPSGRSSPSQSVDSPRSTHSDSSREPDDPYSSITVTSLPVQDDLNLTLLDDDPVATSSPAVSAPPVGAKSASLEKKRVSRQRSDDRPQARKKLGPVKLGAKKIKKMESAEPQTVGSSETTESQEGKKDIEDNLVRGANLLLPLDNSVEESTVNGSSVKEFAVKESTVTESAVKEFAVKESAVEESAVEESVVDKADELSADPSAQCSAGLESDDISNTTKDLKQSESVAIATDKHTFHEVGKSEVDIGPDILADDVSEVSTAPLIHLVESAHSPTSFEVVKQDLMAHSSDPPTVSADTAVQLNGEPVKPASNDTLDPSADLFIQSAGSDLLIVSTNDVMSSSLTYVGDDGDDERSEVNHVTPEQDISAKSVDELTDPEKSLVTEQAIEAAAADEASSIGEIITKSGSSDDTVTYQEAGMAPPLQTLVDEPEAARDADERFEEYLSAAPSVMEQSACSDNSYVKCELPSSATLNRVDSGHEFYRGTPSEYSDFETATSSDIEIISMASTYGDGNGEARMMDFVPLSRSVFKTRIRHISPDEELSPCSPQISPSSDPSSGNSPPSPPSAEATDNPLDTKVLLKKLSQLTEVLEARETKLLSLSTDHGELLEVNAHLKRRIEQMEETNGALDLVKDEFGQRLHELERKLQNSLREKELVKKQLMTTQEELHNRAGTSGKMQRMVEDKDEQISSLMAEGEKLAKQQLQSNNLIKKLRKKEKEQEELCRDQREKIGSLNGESERLKAVLDSKIQNETKHSELIKQLNAAVTTYQTENQKLKSDAEEALEKQKRAESAVDNSYREIAELHKAAAAKDTQIRELRLGNETHHKEELHIALERKQKEALRDADHLTDQIEDMQLTISRMEKEQYRREACLKEENEDLLEKLDNADKRNNELTQSVMAASKPLLRQIENLQSSYRDQFSSWEKVERSLSDRLAEAQSQLASTVEKERQLSENSIELSSRINTLEAQLSSLKQERSRLTAELEMSKMKITTLQDERNGSVAQLEIYKSNIEADRMEAKKSYTLLDNKFELEKSKTEVEKKKHLALMEQLNEKEQQIQELTTSRMRNTPSPGAASEEGRSNQNMRRSMKQDELLARALSNPTVMGSSLYDNMRNHTTTSLLENLESQVKQREGEIIQLQADILEHERTRESLTKEMVKLTEENVVQELKIKQLSKLQQQYKELNGRYQALLQMYGEKEEQVTELRMDLMDVKQMYKQQIDSLL